MSKQTSQIPCENSLARVTSLLSMKWYFLNPLVALIVLSSILRAQEAPKPPPAPLLDSKMVLEAAKAINSEKYPDAKTVLVSKHVRTYYETNGAFMPATQELTKAMT